MTANGARPVDTLAETGIVLPFPEPLVAAVAARVATLLEPCLASRPEPTPWLDVAGAAAYMVCDARRVYDLTSAGKLRCAKDGRRSLFRREWLDAYLEEAEKVVTSPGALTPS